MDKYTVDLDQVLNDFEYSELTDQQSRNASEKPQGTTVFQPAPVTKHSINNVFHSLNEYLNSEISSSNSRVQLQGEILACDQQNLGKYDNNITDIVAESYKTTTKPSGEVKVSVDVNSSQLTTINNSLGNSGQNERLLKLKNEPQTVDIMEKVENNFAKDELEKMQLQEDLLADALHPNLVELVDENPGSIIKEIQDTPTLDTAPEQVNEDLYKTDNQNFSLLDAEIVELIPGLNCIKNNIRSEMQDVYNDKECDKIIDNKADINVNNEQIKFVEKDRFFDVSECETKENNDINVDTSKIDENKKETSENGEKASYDSLNSVKNVENFVIETSESPYALGDSVNNEKDSKCEEILEIPLEDSDLIKSDENVLKLETIEELSKENHNQNNSLHTIQQINANVDSLKQELPKNNNSEINKDSNIGSTTDSKENNATSNTDEEKLRVGFSTDLDFDENELNKMLEDLELDEGVDLNKIEDCFVEQQEEEGSKECIEANRVVSNGQNVIEESDSEQAQPISNKEIPVEEPIIEDADKHLPRSKDNTDNHLIECLEIEKPSKSKTKSSKLRRKTDNIGESGQASQETPASDIEGTAETDPTQSLEDDEKLSLQKQHSRDSLTRPQDLPLKNDLEENVTRKIDLIGSPGSTPYNNVYINKSIEPKTTQDTDSDYTSSASPTFSDCSTESTSTASTVSVEDLPERSEGITKNPGHKRRHHQKSGAVKNRESGQGKQRDADKGVIERDENAQGDTLVADSEQSQDAEGAVGLVITDENVADILRAAGDDSQPAETFLDKSWLGKEAPLWIPDGDASSCLHCDMKFTVLKRRHHCRACGLVLCSKCCNLKFRLEYLDAEARVCTKCYDILNKDSNNPSESGHNTSDSGDSPAFRPNPNNPLEYCSTVSPLQQIGAAGAPPPSVMVPVGVLKRKGSNKKSNKSVMFCDGIAPGSDLTHLDQDFNYQETKTQKVPAQKVPEEVKKTEEAPPAAPAAKSSRNQPKVDEQTGCFIPKSETSLPPTVSVNKTDILYSDCSNSPSVVEMLKNEALNFAINQNLFVQVKLINMSCCINKQAWCFSTDGLINVGSDEIVYLIEYIDEESFVPKDVFFHINNVYVDAVKGTSVKEQGLSLHNTSNFLDSKNHAGFVYIRPTFQCLENVLKPKEPYLIGILIHRWETPWAKLFPLRLILRLGAEYRYYPSPLISTRHRDSVFVEIGHTIINLLADFRNFTYTLPQIRGLIIHMEDKKTTITIPRNRYDQVMKSINNSSDHILAFAGNFSSEADSHLVCIQDTTGHENCYTTHAINIHNKPRKITGASFIVFNGSLKSSSGLTAKSNIVEDGLMIQIPSERMDKIRDSLRTMKNHTIACGCINASSDETVNIVWGENDVEFNAGVQSTVDLFDMKGVPSIRVHNGKDYFCNNGSRLIRWTEVFILQNGEENSKNQDPVDISKVSESIAKACCTALVKYLDLLVSNSCQKIGIRVTLHVENVSYLAGSNGLKLPPIYMRSLDNELVPVLHRITSNNLGDNAVVLELIFRILNA